MGYNQVFTLHPCCLHMQCLSPFSLAQILILLLKPSDILLSKIKAIEYPNESTCYP